jgi:molecular chaperone GrpE
MSEPVEPTTSSDVPPPPPPSEAEARLAEVQRELETARARVNDFARAYQAAEAEKEAFKHRLQRERDQLLDLEKGRVALVLLETVDELELCLAAAPGESALVSGVRLIREGLLRKLDAAGVERVSLEGTVYDPNLAEATDLVATAVEGEDGRVLEVQRACYRLKGKVLRAGRVRVGRHVKAAQA